jgi:hypothetical protein
VHGTKNCPWLPRKHKDGFSLDWKHSS